MTAAYREVVAIVLVSYLAVILRKCLRPILFYYLLINRNRNCISNYRFKGIESVYFVPLSNTRAHLGMLREKRIKVEIQLIYPYAITTEL